MTYNLSSFKLGQSDSVMSHGNWNGFWEAVYGDISGGLMGIYIKYYTADGSGVDEAIATRCANVPTKADRATISADQWNANVQNIIAILNEFIGHTSEFTISNIRTWTEQLMPNKQRGDKIYTADWNALVDNIQAMLQALQDDADEKFYYYSAWKFGDPMPIILY